ncbi:hypothetical protein AB0D46_13350 [Streptomyces sp. NPDC048383]|uniref:hypothetical protein n=1 Tax=Streptomyces sp. NPDC048383 TaxID=3155386 RepID=UPI0034456547
MTSATLLSTPTMDLSDFDLEIQTVLTGDPNIPIAPTARFTSITCTPANTTNSFAEANVQGPICC